jgi:hypothetical protein
MQRQASQSLLAGAADGHSDVRGCTKGDVCVAVPRQCSSSDGSSVSWSLLAKVHLLSVEVAYPAELFLTVFYWALLHSEVPPPPQPQLPACIWVAALLLSACMRTYLV